ncbi:MAG: AAA family ATPase [Candidatus Omnitrophota bacterium]
MKNLPIGIQTFSKLINGGYLYVDKTKQIHDLFATGGQYYFLSRPRRFGKSLLISTLAELFSGNKELFKGLWIYDQIDWESHPVIQIDFSTIDFSSPKILKESLKIYLNETAHSHGLTLNKKKSYKDSFVELIKKLSVKGSVVILIDEYDKPLIEYLGKDKIDTAKEIQSVLKNFYGVIKGSDAFIRFVFIAGISKFSKVSVFSDLNNLVDITIDDKFSTLLGYTEAELNHYFGPYIEAMSRIQSTSISDLKETIRKWYNGYSWDGKNFVYNPFSILNLFNKNRFENFWFSTGTPTFLIKLIMDRQYELMEFENIPVNSFIFDSYDIENLEITGLLFQTGYLTIKTVTVRDMVETYHLSYPNHEVRESFLSHLFGAYTTKDMILSTRIIERINASLKADDIDGFIRELKSLFASIPYNIFIEAKEAYYHSIIYLILRLSGAEVRCEEATNIGRIDAVLETVTKIIVMEFKMGAARDALTQIQEMKYHEKFLNTGKAVVLLGIGFDPEKRNIGDYFLETLQSSRK